METEENNIDIIKNAPELSIVTVTYNERENISQLIKVLNNEFEKNNINGEVIVVDDSSPDGTWEEVLLQKERFPNTTLIKRAGKLGIASAYRDGINAATGKIIIPMDADFSHPPLKVADLYRAACSGSLVLGSRYQGKTEFQTDLAHLFGTTMLNAWIRLVLKTKASDHSNGFLAIPREVLIKVRDFSGQRGFDPFDYVLYGIVLTATARRLDIPVVEVKAPYERRKFGETKINFMEGVKLVLGNMKLAWNLRNRLK
jgi:dolichol-phosphate mannosyltransferase